jgi:hypothetical protein
VSMERVINRKPYHEGGLGDPYPQAAGRARLTRQSDRRWYAITTVSSKLGSKKSSIFEECVPYRSGVATAYTFITAAAL